MEVAGATRAFPVAAMSLASAPSPRPSARSHEARGSFAASRTPTSGHYRCCSCARRASWPR
eukprot:3659446-Prymnesium_polylepis.1